MVIPLNFNSLPPADQADLLLAEGVFLNTRREADQVIDRYRLHDFLVEVCYSVSTVEPIAVTSFYPKQRQSPIYQMQVPRLSIRKGA